jgi:hypothetical protein
LNYQCLSSTSGTLTYDLTGAANGTYTGQAILFNNNSYSNILKTITITIGTPSRFGHIGFNGIVPAIVLIGTLFAIGIAAGSLPYALILGVIGISISYAFGLANFAIGVIMSLIGIAIIIWIFSRRRTG